jgi:hypothetical protein
MDGIARYQKALRLVAAFVIEFFDPSRERSHDVALASDRNVHFAERAPFVVLGAITILWIGCASETRVDMHSAARFVTR